MQQGGCRFKFKKGELIGAGSFGQVFLGLNEATGALCTCSNIYIHLPDSISKRMSVYVFFYIYMKLHTCMHYIYKHVCTTGELLAIKEVDCSRAGEAAISDLEAEITMLQQLRHPNIGTVHDVEVPTSRACVCFYLY